MLLTSSMVLLKEVQINVVKILLKYVPIALRLYIPSLFFFSLIGLMALFLGLYPLGFGIPFFIWILGLTGHIVVYKCVKKVNYLSLYGCILSFDWMIGSIINRMMSNFSGNTMPVLTNVFCLICLIGMLILSFIYVKSVKSLKIPINRIYTWEDFEFDFKKRLEKDEKQWKIISQNLSDKFAALSVLKTKLILSHKEEKPSQTEEVLQTELTLETPILARDTLDNNNILVEKNEFFDTNGQDDEFTTVEEDSEFKIIDYQADKEPKVEPIQTQQEKVKPAISEKEISGFYAEAPLPEPPPDRRLNKSHPERIKSESRTDAQQESQKDIQEKTSDQPTVIEEEIPDTTNSFWKFKE